MMVAEDQREALFTVVRDRDRVNMLPILVRLRGLSPEKRYRIAETGEIFGGDELMGAGLLCPLGKGEGASLLYHLKEAEA